MLAGASLASQECTRTTGKTSREASGSDTVFQDTFKGPQKPQMYQNINIYNTFAKSQGLP
jgi:hypothetical protein